MFQYTKWPTLMFQYPKWPTLMSSKYGLHAQSHCPPHQLVGARCTVKKEMKARGESEILHEIVCDTVLHENRVPVVSQTISCSILKSPLFFVFFQTVFASQNTITMCRKLHNYIVSRLKFGSLHVAAKYDYDVYCILYSVQCTVICIRRCYKERQKYYVTV